MPRLLTGPVALALCVAGVLTASSTALAQPAFAAAPPARTVPADAAGTRSAPVTTTFAQAAPASAAANPADALAVTPPMGFNDWNAFGCNVDEPLITATADLFVSAGLKAAGYQYVNIDDCWMATSRDAAGRLVADPVKFPHGIGWVADYVHGKGLKLGIYESAGTMTCAGYPGSLGHEEVDAQTFADWGIDYLKYDNCYNNGDTTTQQYIARYTTMEHALLNTGRPIVYSLCEWGINDPWTWDPKVGQLWRTTDDIADNWNSVASIIRANLALYPYAGPSRWNDPDMLQVGNGGMTDTEYRTHFGLWAMMAAPLLIGTDLRKATPETMSILRNADLIAIDQDPLGRQARPVIDENGHVVFTKTLADGDVAVAFYNESDSTAQLTASAATLALPSANRYALREVWTGATTQAADRISAVVPPHGTTIYRVTPAPVGDRLAPLTTALLSLPGVATAGGHPLIKPGQPTPATATFGNYGRGAVRDVVVSMTTPTGWTATPVRSPRALVVGTDQTFSSDWTITAPATAEPGKYDLSVDIKYTYSGPVHARATDRVSVLVANRPPTGRSYLSDQPWLSATNGWGPVEKDTSNGEQAAGDGGPITINGMRYAKGLGTNAPSEVDYYLAGACSTVTAQVGIDDEKSANANATFQIFADDRKVADSGAMTSADDVRALTANVTGASLVRLVVDDNGSPDSDHADWGDLTVTCA